MHHTSNTLHILMSFMVSRYHFNDMVVPLHWHADENLLVDVLPPWPCVYRHTCTEDHVLTNTPAHVHTSTPPQWDNSTPPHTHTDTPAHWHTDTPIHRHTNTLAHRHTGTQTHWNTDTPTHRHTDTLPQIPISTYSVMVSSVTTL